MALEQVIKCDGCGTILEKSQEIYLIDKQVQKLWHIIEVDYHSAKLHFCYPCAINIFGRK